jgi:AcrR family transcriptional regulator
MTFSTGSLTLAPAAPDAADRIVRFVDAARDLANETGTAAFTVAQVTGRARLSLKSFYRCFPGKDDLLVALLAADSRIGAALLEERIGAATGADAVHRYVTELFALLTLPDAIGYAGVLVREHRRLIEHSYAEERVALSPLVDLLARSIAQAAPHRADAHRDAETMFTVLLDGIHDIVTGHADDPRELGEYLHGFCTRGMGIA